jgi:hypothetical protein
MAPLSSFGDLQPVVAALQAITVAIGNLVSAVQTHAYTASVGGPITASEAASASEGGAPPELDGYITIDIPRVGLRKVAYYK